MHFLFESGIDYSTGPAWLRTARFTFILLTRDNDIQDAQLASHTFFQTLQSAQPAMVNPPLILLYDPISARALCFLK
jgi:hypothetical protein